MCPIAQVVLIVLLPLLLLPECRLTGHQRAVYRACRAAVDSWAGESAGGERVEVGAGTLSESLALCK